MDVWEPKVLRAGAGAHFRLHLINNLKWELIGKFSRRCILHVPSKQPSPLKISGYSFFISEFVRIPFSLTVQTFCTPHSLVTKPSRSLSLAPMSDCLPLGTTTNCSLFLSHVGDCSNAHSKSFDAFFIVRFQLGTSLFQ